MVVNIPDGDVRNDGVACHTLREGDSFWFEITVGHRWDNPSSEEAVLLWINTPPTF
jgi:quercetin dioxygenase-like cupin family protein